MGLHGEVKKPMQLKGLLFLGTMAVTAFIVIWSEKENSGFRVSGANSS